MPKHIIKQGAMAVYEYNRKVYKYPPFASFIATLIMFEGVRSPRIAAAKARRYATTGAKS